MFNKCDDGEPGVTIRIKNQSAKQPSELGPGGCGPGPWPSTARNRPSRVRRRAATWAAVRRYRRDPQRAAAPGAQKAAARRARAVRQAARAVGAAPALDAPLDAVTTGPTLDLMDDVYELYCRGTELLKDGQHHQATIPLSRARYLAPDKTSIR